MESEHDRPAGAVGQRATPPDSPRDGPRGDPPGGGRDGPPDDVGSCTDAQLVAHARGPHGALARRARDELAARYRPLVLARAARLHRDRGGDHDDVVSVGHVGLLKAVRDYDPDRGVPFAAYAGAKVVGEMMRWFRDNRYAAHVPRPAHEQAMAVSAAARRLETRLAGSPDSGQLARATGLTVREVGRARRVHAAERRRRGELPAAPAVVAAGGADDDAEALIALRSALSRLDERDRRLLAARYWAETPQREIGEELGVSQAQVSRLERRALDRLRSLVRGHG